MVPVNFWYGFSALVSGLCAMGINKGAKVDLATEWFKTKCLGGLDPPLFVFVNTAIYGNTLSFIKSSEKFGGV